MAKTVSVIIPVYNTEKYLDKCIQSILCQTYKELEIIFINDGSTDGSLQILEKYQAEDDRIQIISVENGGQGKARNIGIEKASGEFIMFVDSDDWISKDCVEILYKTVEDKQCDIAIGNVTKTQFDKEMITFAVNPKIPVFINKDNKKAFLFNILLYSFAQLIRKKLFVENGIFFPSHYFEDVATMPLVYAVADTICYQKDVVYYYRNRTGSTVNNANLIYDRILCISTLENELKRLGLYKEYNKEFLRFVCRRSRINRRQVRALLDRQYQEFERRQFIFDYQTLGEIDDRSGLNVYVFGSYNLMIAVKIFLRLRKTEYVPNYFGFQNLISIISTKSKTLDSLISCFPAENPFRRAALVQDFEKTMVYQERKKNDRIDYFILDFLEERYGTGHISNTCFTLSDAFMDVKPYLNMEYDVTESFGAEWERMWQEKCDLFIQFVRERTGDGRIVLVKMKLAEKYKQEGEEYFFDNVESIRYKNEYLEQCYAYFIKNCPEALVIDVEHLECYFTDRNFRHGCFPWHLNDIAYREISRKIKEKADFQKYMELMEK